MNNDKPPYDSSGLWGFSVTSEPAQSRWSTDDEAPQVAGYRLTAKLGEGGMGTVWRAEQISTRREVALKTLAHGALASEAARRRFEREVELAARLQHPHIARVFEAGSSRGVGFYSMELIDGLPLDEFVNQRKLDPSRIVELMRMICEAVQHAHQQGVIHRDLKPANVLVTADGQPHVLDFGLAKTLLEEDGRDSLLTREGVTAGTPAYMSPEQASGETHRIDTRTDVYALGVILFRLLTGQHPCDMSGPRHEMLRRIAAGEVRRPRKLRPSMSADLEAVVLKALAHQPRDRYSSAGELASDLARYQANEPVSARPLTLSYLLRKQVRRHRGPIALSTMVLALFVGVIIYAFVQIAQALTVAESRLAASLIAESKWHTFRFWVGDWKTAKDRLAEAATVMTDLGQSPALAHLSTWATMRVSPTAIMSFDLGGKPMCIAPLPPGRHLAIAVEKQVRRYDPLVGQLIDVIAEHPTTVTAIAVSKDGSLLASGDANGGISVRQLNQQSLPVSITGHSGRLNALTFNDAGSQLVSGDSNGLLLAHNPATAERQVEIQMEPELSVQSISFFPDQERVFLFVLPNRGEIWNLPQKQRLFAAPKGQYPHMPAQVMLDHKGTNTITAGLDRITLRDAATSEIAGYLFAHTRPTTAIALSETGAYLASTSTDGTVMVWDMESTAQWKVPQRFLHCFTDHIGPTRGVCFIPKLPLVASIGDDGTCKVWTLRELDHLSAFGTQHMNYMCFSRDGRMALNVMDESHGPELFDVASGFPLRRFPIESRLIHSVALSPDCRTAAFGYFDGRLELWDVESTKLQSALRLRDESVRALDFSNDGSLLVATDGRGLVRLYQRRQGKVEERWSWPLQGGPKDVAFSPDANHIAVCTVEGAVTLLTTDASPKVTSIKAHDESTICICFAPDGKNLFAGGAAPDSTVKMFTVEGLRHVRTFAGEISKIVRLACARDGKYIASGSEHAKVVIWETATGREVESFNHHGSEITDLLFFGIDRDLMCGGAGGGHISHWRFGSTPRLLEQGYRAPVARLTANPNDGAALRELGEWYLNRGLRPWAVELLDKARSKGESVPYFTTAVARLYARSEQLAEGRRDLLRAAKEPVDPLLYRLFLTGTEEEMKQWKVQPLSALGDEKAH